MKHYVISKGLLPPPQKQKRELANVCFCPLPPSVSFPLSHRRPPPVLTLACLSGLLPCIPPFPVWPLSQEVAQLVDKHHGGDEEEGVREVPPDCPPPGINGSSLMEMDSSLGWRTVVDSSNDR